VATSGYVSGGIAEAIEEVADAALAHNMTVFHLGPKTIEGMAPRSEATWVAKTGITDFELAEVYQQTKWISGLRHVEGFELGVLEGLACGARPFVFDRPEMRRWFTGFAVFIPECSGAALVEKLVALFAGEPAPVLPAERAAVLRQFSWERVAKGFWSALPQLNRRIS
jgi:hypothetical protein